MRYEYRRMVGSAMQRAFFETFAQICRELGAISRVQCHGAPTDLLAAYASVDVPESEALLFEPHFSRIPASAAALAGKSLVSAETFSCIYGFVGPGRRAGGSLLAPRADRRSEAAGRRGLRERRQPDRLARDAVQRARAASKSSTPRCTSGRTSAFAGELPAFNEYLETVSGMLRRGRPYASLAVYLPNEDMLMRDRIPEEQRTPGAVFEWEMRQRGAPAETEGYHPLWVSELFLRKAEFVDGQIEIGDVSFAALYLDCEWLDAAALEEVVRLARDGAKIVLKRPPALPGMRRHPQYAGWLAELARLPNVHGRACGAGPARRWSRGDDLPFFWAREGERELLIFFAHPLAREVRYPMAYGQSYCDGPVERR